MKNYIPKSLSLRSHNIFVILFLIFNVWSADLKAQELIWVEAEQFSDIGGWTKDWQFIEQMGSPYLLSIGLGSPVVDAKTTIEVPKPGNYRMWVRTYDWNTKDHSGEFNLYVDEQKAKSTLGKAGDKDWVWEDAGTFSLGNEVKLRLADMTGYYGRCDAIVLSSDLDWAPPTDKEDIWKLRIKYGSVSAKIKQMETYDVVVIGGGLAGCLAAVSAARQGAKTVLIQNRGQLGGNSSHEIMVPPVGTRPGFIYPEERKYDPRETGLIEEIANYGGQNYFEVGKYFPERLARLVESEPNLDLFLNTHGINVEMNNESEIKNIITVNVHTGERLRFPGEIFIDCTGNGVIGLKAGADYRYGKESKSVHNEEKAVNEESKNTLGSSLKYWYEEKNSPISFQAPEWIYKFPSCSDFAVKRHPRLGPDIDDQWMVELGGDNKTYANAEAVRDDLLRLIYGIWDHVKNHCTEGLREKSDRMALVWVSHVIGIRESYRLMGDYVLTEKDVTEQPFLKDRVAYGGWGLDEHPDEGFFEKERFNNYTHGGVIHSIPYRSLYSRNINNLMMAGRDISVTHVALTGTRVMYTTGIIGQATGLAAGMCIEKSTSPRGIYQNYLEELQQRLLKTGAYLHELPNEDPNDKALISDVSASSERYPATNVINGHSRATLSSAFPNASLNLNAWIPDQSAEGKPWIQLTWPTVQKINVLHIIFQNRGELAPKEFYVEKLSSNSDSNWERIINVDNTNGLRRFVLPIADISTKGIRIVLTEKEPSGGICEIRAYDEPDYIIEQIKRSNNLRNEPLPNVLLPWEKDTTKR